MKSKLSIKLVGRDSDISMAVKFLRKNGYFYKLNYNEPFVSSVYINEFGYKMLLRQVWFICTDIDIYKI